MSCLEYVWPAEQKPGTPRILKKLNWDQFDLATEQIFKVIGRPVAKKQFETPVGYENISCKWNFNVAV